MADICSGSGGVVSPAAAYRGSTASRAARRRRIELRRFKVICGVSSSDFDFELNRRPQMTEPSTSGATTTSESDFVSEREGQSALQREDGVLDQGISETTGVRDDDETLLKTVILALQFGVSSVCGRRRDMEDAVAAHPNWLQTTQPYASTSASTAVSAVDFHYFAVYDGHGCSHVAMRCRERLHELLRAELTRMEEEEEEEKEEKEEKEKDSLVSPAVNWREVMRRSFHRMDKEIVALNEGVVAGNCRCELRSPMCNAVGSTAVVAIVTPEKIVVANCGDSRAVLSRNGKAIALSSDHKPDRPDELNRIQEAGGRVIYWDGPRVLGVLAMSRAIGDNYLKPYVNCEPEVTVTERAEDDDCLIIASDGLWDVVSNDTACKVARICLSGKVLQASLVSPLPDMVCSVSSVPCCDAAMLLTKLALARHSTDNVSVVVVDLRKHEFGG